MESTKNNDNNLIKNNKEKVEEIKENKDIYNSIEKNKNNIDYDINNGQEENYNLLYFAKRSYSCKINGPKNKNFPNEEIKLNLNSKFKYLKTPQIKPKKSQLNPKPINIGSISTSKKRSRFKDISKELDIINDIISEGENEESNELSSDSSSVITDDEEIKVNQENKIEKEIDNENEKVIVEKNNINSKIKSEKLKLVQEEDYKIEEENDDDFDEFGKISLKNLRKGMIQSKKLFLKNDNDIINRIDRKMSEQEQFKKYKDDILKGEENVQNGKQFHKTTGFAQANRKNGCPILEFLKKNSSSGIVVKNK